MDQSKQERDNQLVGEDMRRLELAVIGFVLTQPTRFYEVADLEGYHFTSPTTRKCFETMADIASKDGEAALESITLFQSRITERGVPVDQALDTITSAKDFAPSSPEAMASIKEKLIAAALRRSLQEAASELTSATEDREKTSDELSELASDLIGSAIRRGTVEKVGTLADAMQEEIQRIVLGHDQSMGYRTGFTGLDEKLNGFHGGDLTIIGARTSMGKSSLLNKFAVTLGYEQRLPGVVFSLEMRRQEITQRIICNQARINSHKARSGSMNEHERGRYLNEAERLIAAPIFIHDSGGITAPKIGAITRRLYHEEGVRWMAVDYLQQVDHAQRRNESRNDALSRTSRAMKMLALSLDIPVIVLSQLNREPDKRDNKRPNKSDLRDSGSIEQDADVVLFIYRDDYYYGEDADWRSRNPDKLGVAELIVAKQRNGPTGTVKVRWDSDWAGFSDLAGDTPYDQSNLAYRV